MRSKYSVETQTSQKQRLHSPSAWVTKSKSNAFSNTCSFLVLMTILWEWTFPWTCQIWQIRSERLSMVRLQHLSLTVMKPITHRVSFLIRVFIYNEYDDEYRCTVYQIKLKTNTIVILEDIFALNITMNVDQWSVLKDIW